MERPHFLLHLGHGHQYGVLLVQGPAVLGGHGHHIAIAVSVAVHFVVVAVAAVLIDPNNRNADLRTRSKSLEPFESSESHAGDFQKSQVKDGVKNSDFLQTVLQSAKSFKQPSVVFNSGYGEELGQSESDHESQ